MTSTHLQLLVPTLSILYLDIFGKRLTRSLPISMHNSTLYSTGINEFPKILKQPYQISNEKASIVHIF